MGAQSFHDTAYGKTAVEAYRECVDNAHFSYGIDPYNGTISTTHGFVEIPLEEGETFPEWFKRVLDDKRVGKREDCACTKDPKEANLWHFAGWAAC